jgi:hypothetical protein
MVSDTAKLSPSKSIPVTIRAGLYDCEIIKDPTSSGPAMANWGLRLGLLRLSPSLRSIFKNLNSPCGGG